jgi:hypothetical protein
MKHLALAGVILAIVPACATTTGKVAGTVAAVSTGLAIGIQASGCGGSGDECGLIHGMESGVLLGVAGIAVITALVAESRHHAEAPQPIAQHREASISPPPRAITVQRDPRVAELSASASIEASLGRCTTVAVLGDQIRALDAEYYGAVFLTDPTIARCR